jgi:4-carboxymuconolactone decarboxylase
MTSAQRQVFDAVVNGRRGTLVGPLRAALHNPELADRWQKLGEVLRYNTVFPAAFSELAILVTARRWNCELEWVIHSGAARDAGLPDAAITAIRDGRPPVFDDPAMQEIYDYICALQSDGQVSDETHGAIVARWGALGVVELTAITGYYTMVAMTLNAHRIPLPPDQVPELFPDGAQPPQGLSDLPRSRQRQDG